MIQVNLLPDIKLSYLKAQQTKHLVIVVAILASLVSVAILAILFLYVQIVQPRHRANLQSDIDSSISELKSKENGVKIVTVQGVLEQISALQDKKQITSNLFSYLTNFTPNAISYNEVKLDLPNNTLSLNGQASTLEETNELANNLKSASFSYTQNETQQKVQPFSRIVFESLGKSEQSTTDKNVSFQLSLTFNPVMFKEGIISPSLTVDAASEKLLLPSAKPFEAKPEGGAQ